MSTGGQPQAAATIGPLCAASCTSGVRVTSYLVCNLESPGHPTLKPDAFEPGRLSRLATSQLVAQDAALVKLMLRTNMPLPQARSLQASIAERRSHDKHTRISGARTHIHNDTSAPGSQSSQGQTSS